MKTIKEDISKINDPNLLRDIIFSLDALATEQGIKLKKIGEIVKE